MKYGSPYSAAIAEHGVGEHKPVKPPASGTSRGWGRGWAAYQRSETDDNLPGGAHSSKTGQEVLWQRA